MNGYRVNGYGRMSRGGARVRRSAGARWRLAGIAVLCLGVAWGTGAPASAGDGSFPAPRTPSMEGMRVVRALDGTLVSCEMMPRAAAYTEGVVERMGECLVSYGCAVVGTDIPTTRQALNTWLRANRDRPGTFLSPWSVIGVGDELGLIVSWLHAEPGQEETLESVVLFPPAAQDGGASGVTVLLLGSADAACLSRQASGADGDAPPPAVGGPGGGDVPGAGAGPAGGEATGDAGGEIPAEILAVLAVLGAEPVPCADARLVRAGATCANGPPMADAQARIDAWIAWRESHGTGRGLATWKDGQLGDLQVYSRQWAVGDTRYGVIVVRSPRRGESSTGLYFWHEPLR